ncbi:MAG: hypothetical protein LBU57_05985 [Dysgonamonadaceae bacterium]|jgi:hypothetical protein|nr:hypothetical protein [Dysgonamonadaceae bacterium]
MKSGLIITVVFLSSLALNISAQENRIDTTKFGAPSLYLPSLKSPSLLRDTTNFFDLPDGFEISKPRELEFPDSAIMIRNWEHLSYIRKPVPKKPLLPFGLVPDLNFNLGASRWELPVLGATTTFSPTLTYTPFERLFFYGGVGFTQYHNLSYVQNMIAPGWPVKSNITSQGFLGGAFILNDRITLHGTYQRSLYNQLPANMVMFAPSFQMATFGADIDVWHGLGVTVERVWQFDKSGRMRSDMRYSPYINFDKFMKFLRGY